MVLVSLRENDSSRKRRPITFWISLFIVSPLLALPLHGLAEDVTVELATTKDMILECYPPCNATGNQSVECVYGECECLDLGYNAVFTESLNVYNCIDNDECNTTLNNCDSATSVCENTIGSFQCKCKDGFSKDSSSKSCIDIDECSENLHNCEDITSFCKNTLGSYDCDCKHGFSRNASVDVCTNINECLSDPAPCNFNTQNCTDTYGSYECTCLDGTTNCESCLIWSIECVIFIVICAAVALLIITAIILILVIVCIRRSRKKLDKPPTRKRDVELDLEPVYDEPVLETGASNVAALLIPRGNIDLGHKVFEEGRIEYHKAKVTLPDQHQRQDGIVKTITETSSAGVSTLITNEVEKLSLLPSHPYVVELLGWCNAAPSYIIFEFVHDSSLLVGLKEGRVQKSDGTKVALQVARGMKFLSEKGFLHPGLRAEKILLSKSGECKLYDFVPEELALELKKLAWNEHPPYQWLSPEYLFLEELTRTGDVWSFGILLWEIFSKGEQPFHDKDRLLVQKCIRQEDPILSKPPECPGGVWRLVLQCWEQRPEERANFQHLSSEFFLMTEQVFTSFKFDDGGSHFWKLCALDSSKTLFNLNTLIAILASCNSLATQTLADVGIRLSNGEEDSEGLVEVLFDGQWGTVCDDGWDIADAHVACRQLGFGYAVSAYGEGSLGRGTGPIVMDEVNCVGDEERLDQCSFREMHDCVHQEDAGVKCSNEDGGLRLIHGNTLYEGRVEYFRSGAWGTVCDDNWDNKDAAVVCRELGFGYPATAYGGAYYGEGTGRIVLSNIDCDGTERRLKDCVQKSGLVSNCDHSEDAGVKCTAPDNPIEDLCNTYDVRIVEGSTEADGLIEVCYKGVWGKVCANSWTNDDGLAICRQVGYTVVDTVYSRVSNSLDSNQIVESLSCDQGQISLSNCDVTFGNPKNCSFDAGVSCSGRVECTDGRVRLDNGYGVSSGSVQVCQTGQWANVCGTYWGFEEALVLCRQLGYSTVSYYDSDRIGFASGYDRDVLSVSCQGTEFSLSYCSMRSNPSCSLQGTVICSNANPDDQDPSGGGGGGGGHLAEALSGTFGSLVGIAIVICTCCFCCQVHSE